MKAKYKLPKEEEFFFFQTIKEIIYTDDFLKLKQFRHHGNITTYTHVIKVAYLAFCYAVKHNRKINKKELVRSALLHDLYFYDWHDKHNGVHLHGLFHPKKAVKNAQRIYHITKREQRHMVHHMFPLTLIPPTTKEGWIICIFDKIAAKSDYKAIKLKKKALKKASLK
ncbi:MAG: HD domain-containing protein [Anaeroplasmataceae bacterium]|nr:HD domain-containing protein [Anaeroplasmataceae bacterium]